MKPSIIEIAEEEFYNEENNRIMHSKDAEVDTFKRFGKTPSCISFSMFNE